MGLSSGVVWEVRSTGDDTNGGGFDSTVTSPGTDYSQQTAAQVTYTDLVIGATNTQLTSALNNFTSAHVGNLVNVTGGTGFTTGWYTVLSVTTGVATMDRAVGTAASTAGTGKLGGCLASLDKLFTIVNTANLGATGQIAWVKATASYVTTAGLTSTSASGAGIACIGYTTTRGDNGQATLTTATNSIILLKATVNLDIWSFTNFIFSTTAGTKVSGFSISANTIHIVEFVNCTFNGFTNAFDLHTSGGSVFEATFVSCTIENCSNSGIYWDVAFSSVNPLLTCVGCLFTGNNYGILAAAGHAGGRIVLINTVIYNSTSHGFYGNSDSGIFTDQVLYMDCSASVGNGGDGVHMGSGGTHYPHVFYVFNSIFTQNGAYGVNFQSSMTTALGHIFKGRNNAYYGNTTAALLNCSALPGDVTLTGDPFTSKSTGDFSLNSTSGAGAACKAAGWPTAIPGT